MRGLGGIPVDAIRTVFPRNAYTNLNHGAQFPIPEPIRAVMQEGSSIVAQTAAINACRGKNWRTLFHFQL